MNYQDAIEAAAFAVAHPNHPNLLATLSGSYLNIYIVDDEGAVLDPVEAYSTGWQSGFYDDPPIDQVYEWVMETIEWFAAVTVDEDYRPTAPERSSMTER